MRLHPLNDRIIVKRDPRQEKTSGGIIIPATADQKVTQGIVIAVGKGRVLGNGRLVEPEVRVGERVIFNQHSGTDVTVEGEKLLVIRADDVLCVENLPS